MREIEILKQFFMDRLGGGYNVEAFRNALPDYAPSTEVLRVIRLTDEIIADMIADKTVRAVLRTSQSDYIGLSDADGASFIWSLEFAAPTDKDVEADIEKIKADFTDKIIPVEYKKENYELLLTFTMPVKFASRTINGTDYAQLVWGGRATVVKNSVLANGYTFYIDGEKIPGVLSLSEGYTPQGENYSTERAFHQRTAMQTFTNAVGLQIHATANNDVIKRIVAAAQTGGLDGFAFEIKQDGETVAEWDVAVFNQVGVTASLGSYVLIDAQILRS